VACGEPLEPLRESDMLRPGTGRGPKLPDRATSRRAARAETRGVRRTSGLWSFYRGSAFNFGSGETRFWPAGLDAGGLKVTGKLFCLCQFTNDLAQPSARSSLTI